MMWTICLKSKHIRKLIPIILRNENKEKNLNTLLTSKPFLSLYFSKVRSLTDLDHSFHKFYQKYFVYIEFDQETMRLLFKLLIKEPYSLSSAIFLIQNLRKYRPLMPKFDELFKQVKYKNFEIHRLGYID